MPGQLPPLQSGGKTHAPRVPQRQRLLVHESDAMSHPLSHDPQWSKSFVRLRQTLPPQHVSEPPHVRPHAPQFATVSSVVQLPPQQVRLPPQVG